MVDKEEVLEKVTDRLAVSLNVDMDEIERDSRLTEDLGAESIDFLDIVFHLEKAFSIKIPRGDLFPENIQNLLNDSQYVKDGTLTPAGLDMLKEKLPYAELSRYETDPQIGRPSEAIAVGPTPKSSRPARSTGPFAAAEAPPNGPRAHRKKLRRARVA